MKTEHPFDTIRSLGWRWHENGAVLTVDAGAALPVEVFVPLGQIRIIFGEELARVGCPLQRTIGDDSAIGFWGAIKKAARSVSRAVKKVVPKGIRRAASKIAKKALSVAKTAGKVFSSDIAQYVVGAVGVAIPALAPAAAGIIAAQRATAAILKGIKTAERVAKGVKATPQMLSAMAKGVTAKKAVNMALDQARAGNPAGMRFAGAMATLAKTRPVASRAQAVRASARPRLSKSQQLQRAACMRRCL